MREHRLKTWETSFLAVRSGEKRAEFRLNDRDFAVGDELILERFNPGYGSYVDINGRMPPVAPVDRVRVCVTHVVQGAHGIPANFCMLSIALVNDTDAVDREVSAGGKL